ncbi:hypothetical protein BV20DRAFT_967420 [Pilatotrama ljubarskyi]|nr:hypothetical protein BV20DRAFT_967420 [Pilatotrama ljubarskyi]
MLLVMRVLSILPLNFKLAFYFFCFPSLARLLVPLRPPFRSCPRLSIGISWWIAPRLIVAWS